MSIRLSDHGQTELDRLVQEGGFKTRTEAVLVALNLLATVIENQGKGFQLIQVPKKRADEMGYALNIQPWRLR